MADHNDMHEDDGKEGAAPEGGAAAEGAEKSGVNGKKLVLFVVVPLFLLVGGGVGLYFSGVLDGMLGKKDSAEETASADAHGGEGAKDSHGKPLPGAFFLKIPDLLVNLSSTDGTSRYLRLSIQLELKSQADVQAVEVIMPRVIDQFQTYLRELRVKDLQGSAGIYRLQTELLRRVNAAAYPIEVKDVLFQEILIQ